MFVECTEKAEVSGFGPSGQGDNPTLRGRRRLPEEEMQLAGSKDGGLLCTERDLEVQNGNLVLVLTIQDSKMQERWVVVY